MTTASVITGITDEELEALVRGGWVDDRTSTPGWVRWVMVEDWLPVVKQWVFPLLTLSEWKATFGSDENTWADSLNPAQSPAVGRNKIPADPNPPPEPNKTAAPHPPLARTKPENPAPRHINHPRPSTTDIRSLLRDRPDRNPPRPSRAPRPPDNRPQNPPRRTAPTRPDQTGKPHPAGHTRLPRPSPTDDTQPPRHNRPDLNPHPSRAPRPPNNHPQTAPTTRNANPAQTTHSAPTETRRTQAASPHPPTTARKTRLAAQHPLLAWTKPGKPIPPGIPASPARPAPTTCGPLVATAPVGDGSSCAGRGGR